MTWIAAFVSQSMKEEAATVGIQVFPLANFEPDPQKIYDIV